MKVAQETKKLLLKGEDDDEGKEPTFPRCPHGPTVLFYYDGKESEGYFSCSAFRDKKQCPFNISVQDLTMKHLCKEYQLPTNKYRNLRNKFQNCVDEQIHYCLPCNMPLEKTDLPSHSGHEVKLNLSHASLRNPTSFLPPLDNDKGNAQYFFDEKSLQFFEKTLRDLNIRKVICMGAPRLHAHLNNHSSDAIKSFLLDFDYRFFYFYDDHEYAWYNMMNHHFFDESQKREFFKFLKCKSYERLLIFTDPPFGCRTELMGNTLLKITKLYCTINQLPYQPLPTFWIFPYFSATYVQRVMPSLQMCDYKINYTNHDSYTDVGSKSRKLGSPVRMFTNVPLTMLKLPIQELYRYCAKCEKYTALENRHCLKCNCCPSKNGSTYKHCEKCGLCVKPNYTHCRNCRRCTQSEGHNCLEYQKNQKCWICLEVGHTERNCDFWKNKSRCIFSSSESLDLKPESITCLLCDAKGHNELNCKKRSLFLKEFTFMGETRIYKTIICIN